MRRAFYIAAAVATTIAGCGFSIGDDEIGGDDGIAVPDRKFDDRSAKSDASTTTPTNDASTTNPTPDAGTTAPDTGTVPTGPLKAFVSSSIVTGGLGGIAGADKLCNDLAKAAVLPGTYAAWISTAGVNAIDRITADGPWQRVDGQVVAQTKAQLAQAALTTPLLRDEKNQTPPAAEDRVWTATGGDGKFVGGSDCSGWTGAGNGRVGEAVHTDGQWTALTDEECGEVNRVYCFQIK